jgi:hypothetical protein
MKRWAGLLALFLVVAIAIVAVGWRLRPSELAYQRAMIRLALDLNDVEWVREAQLRRYQADLPSLEEVDRFPSLAASQVQCHTLLEVQAVLKKEPPSRERDERLLVNTRQLQAWNLVLRARQEGGGQPRREALDRLRDMLGEEDWKAGRMP